MSAAPSVKKSSPYEDMGELMGMDEMTSVLSSVSDIGRPTFAYVPIAEIKILKQQRPEDEMESEDQTLDDMGNNLDALGMLQPVILCQDEDSAWRMVVGHRRTLSATRKGWFEVPAMCFGQLTDEQIQAIQYAENVHRLNLTQITEARHLKNRLDTEFGGDVKALCADPRIGKSASWVSKRLALLDLPDNAMRLVKENISSDLEVINSVRTIEKRDPEAAKAVVQQLKEDKGNKNSNARKTVQAAKDAVKPPNPDKKPRKSVSNPDNVAKPRDESHKSNGLVKDVPPSTLADDPALQKLQQEFAEVGSAESGSEDDKGAGKSAPFDTSKVPALPPVKALEKAYAAIHGENAGAQTVLAAMPQEERSGVQEWLHSFYDAGTECQNIALAVVQGLRNGSFATEGHGAFALAAFLSGCEEGVMFNPVNIMGTVKA